MHCSSVQGKMHCPLLSAALQNRLTPGLGHCNYTYGDLLFIQVCSDLTEMHCSSVQGKMHCPLFSAALQNRLTPGLGHCNDTYGDLLSIQVCSDPTEMHCSTGQGKLHCPRSALLCKTGSHLAWVTAVTPMEICCSYRCAVTQQKCTAALLGPRATEHECSI